MLSTSKHPHIPVILDLQVPFQATCVVPSTYALLSVLTAISLKTREDYLCRLQDHVLKLEQNLARDRARMADLAEDRLQRMLSLKRKPTPANSLRPQKSERGSQSSATQPGEEVGGANIDG